MAVRSRAMVPSTAARVLIRVESHDHGRLAGRLYNPYLDESVRFDDVIDFTDKLDAMFDRLSFPQATVEYRRFEGKQGKKKAGTKRREEMGGQAMAKHEPIGGQEQDVFVVHVQFRQNATWQGTVKWANQNEEKRFRSTLELLKIMDSAISANHPDDNVEK